MIKNLAFLILSCDKYNDLWNGYLYQLNKYFDLDIPTYFGVNELSPKLNNSKIKIIKSGPDDSWGKSFISIIDQIDEDYILITLEDLYICSKIDHHLMKTAQEMIDGRVNMRHLKYTGFIKGKNNIIPGVSILEADTPYRVTLCGIWNKEYLKSIIQPEETPWQFEINGSARTKMDDGFFALNMPLVKTVNLVEKGFWVRKSIKWAVKQKIPVDPKSRNYKNPIQEIISMVKNSYFNMMIKIPLEMKQKILKKLKKYLVIN
jgi:hypothetical protein